MWGKFKEEKENLPTADQKPFYCVQEFTLRVGEELRVEDDGDENVELLLKEGTAEIFGAELKGDKIYKFEIGARFAVATFHGCRLQIKSRSDSSYISSECATDLHYSLHTTLENKRHAALSQCTRGPVTLIVGRPDSGKTTLCTTLLNYSIRAGETPMFVNLDYENASISLPGTFTATILESQSSIEENKFLEQPSFVHLYGLQNPQKNQLVYSAVISKMAEGVKQQLENNHRVNFSGVIINMGGWIPTDGYNNILHVVKAFGVDTVMVMNQEKLHYGLSEKIPSSVKVVALPKTAGIVRKSLESRMRKQFDRIPEFFFGKSPNIFPPHSFSVPLSHVKVVRIGMPGINQHLVPIGYNIASLETTVFPIKPTAGKLLHRVFGISHVDDEYYRNKENNNPSIPTRVSGFVCVTGFDAKNETMTVLSTQPEPFSQTTLIFSEIMMKNPPEYLNKC